MKKCHGKVKIWKDEKDQRFSIIFFIFMTLQTQNREAFFPTHSVLIGQSYFNTLLKLKVITTSVWIQMFGTCASQY